MMSFLRRVLFVGGLTVVAIACSKGFENQCFGRLMYTIGGFAGRDVLGFDAPRRALGFFLFCAPGVTPVTHKQQPRAINHGDW
jgi:hypothetical protein